VLTTASTVNYPAGVTCAFTYGFQQWRVNRVAAPIDFTARRTQAMIPGSRLVIYDDAPHALFLTEHERFSRDLAEFARG